MNFQAGTSARQSARDLIFTGLGPLADGAIFIAAVGAGMAVGVAHIISFAVAGLLNYLLIVRGVIASSGRSWEPRLHIHLLVVNLAALFLRGDRKSVV